MGFRAALGHRGFAALWGSQLVSRLGDGIHEIALVWVIYEVTGDPSLLGVIVAASALPMAISALPAGSLVDAWDRRHVLIGASLLRGGAVLLIPLVGRGPMLVPVVVGVAVTTGVIEAFATPARGALIPNLVPERDRDAANALFEFTRSASRTLYVLGGIVIAVFGSFAAFYLDAASFVVAAVALLAVPRDRGRPNRSATRGERPKGRHILADVRSGIRFVRSHPLLPSVVLLSLLTTLTMAPLAVVLPFYARSIVGGGSVAFGLLYGAVYAGIVVGAIGIGAFDAVTTAYRGRVIVAGIACLGVALVATAIVPARSPAPLRAAAATLLAFGIAFTVVNTPVQTLVQSSVPDERRGMVFAVLAGATVPALPAGALLAGPLIERFSATGVLFGQGVLLVGASLVLALTPLASTGRALGTDHIAGAE